LRLTDDALCALLVDPDAEPSPPPRSGGLGPLEAIVPVRGLLRLGIDAEVRLIVEDRPVVALVVGRGAVYLVLRPRKPKVGPFVRNAPQRDEMAVPAREAAPDTGPFGAAGRVVQEARST